eukprot:2325662-Rhodomonas_salina.1
MPKQFVPTATHSSPQRRKQDRVPLRERLYRLAASERLADAVSIVADPLETNKEKKRRQKKKKEDKKKGKKR